MNSSPSELWFFLPIGYALTVVVETTVLWFGLSRQHGWKTRVAAGLWLTACTYPVVVLVLPIAMQTAGRTAYLLVAETFTPLAECALFRLALGGRTISESDPRPVVTLRDYAAIVAANLASFGTGEIIGPSIRSWLT